MSIWESLACLDLEPSIRYSMVTGVNITNYEDYTFRCLMLRRTLSHVVGAGFMFGRNGGAKTVGRQLLSKI